MKTGMTIGGAIAALLAAATPAIAAEGDAALLGRWSTQEQGGVVEIYRCGGAICGRVIDGIPLRADPEQRDIRNDDPRLRTRKIKNLVVLNGFTGGPEAWTGGSVYDPNSGQGASRGFLTLDDRNTLRVKGCIAMILCRTQTWTRARS